MTVTITVLGIVQGVGYRPFTARLAKKLEITGTVLNSGGIVQIIANGKKEAVDEFVHRLKSQQPAGADVTKIQVSEIPEQNFADFKIVQSTKTTEETPIIPPDLPMCETCRQELYSPENRRYRYPFISCVACGPRYSIINTLPYDRENITMGDFPMCADCKKEYTGDDRRRHAQTISCHDCGPQLILQVPSTVFHTEEALQKAIELLKNGAVLAIKGIGGYQFACSPKNAQAVENLRLLKHREKKPFAVMFSSLDSCKEYCVTTPKEKKLLLSTARPIVLLPIKKHTFCEGVSGESRFLGAFLAYTPLHQLLTDACGPLVMTSGNLTSEPIITQDEDMLKLSSPYLGGVLYNLRRIVTPLDDSVARVVNGELQVIRRSRGYVPLPIYLQQRAETPVLAMGGDLKSCFCLSQNDRAYLSQYFGDMEHYEVSQVYQKNLTRMQQIFGITPKIIACDLHPNYHTSQLAEELVRQSPETKLQKIQHHHAHIGSVMAEHNLSECIGVAFDGTGYGTDGCIWGGEFLLCKGAEYNRCAHLSYVKLCGGDAAALDATLTVNCYLAAMGEQGNDDRFAMIQAALKQNINTQQSSSMGRLFDAVSAILGIRKANSYEGECAIALENAAAAAQQDGIAPYPLHFTIEYGKLESTVDQVGLLKDMLTAVKSGVEKGALALGFHEAICEMVLHVCSHIREQSGENKVALSGGVFGNLLLTQGCVKKLENANFEVFLNSQVPTNDGGICLGQAFLCSQMN
jgi:hydrogenase maturation protein HypF